MARPPLRWIIPAVMAAAGLTYVGACAIEAWAIFSPTLKALSRFLLGASLIFSTAVVW
ncbi:hypothetical protein [Paramagnetospirillum marisnigri]|uniref:hypothetical protein n=1 Tax=Paramagnetospirillum marisnigri TaxID=1285242 RepID=UPI000A757778|nr:hypothetical protein [Paramagnetospirillum marisnigri]